jgi:hypothetical protein
VFASAGCGTVTFLRNPETRTFVDATYESRKAYWWWGLKGGPYDEYVDQICLGKNADEVMFERTASDLLVTFATLGVYAPRTVKIWCQL